MQVASRMRGRPRAGFGRLRSHGWGLLQIAIGTPVAWQLATTLLGHARPFFAVVPVIVCLGTSTVQRLRRVAELGLGVTIGIAVAGVLVHRIGAGWWQMALVVMLSTSIAVFMDGGPLLTAQAGVNAVFIVGLAGTVGTGVGRWADALVGCVVALLVAALLPRDPRPAIWWHADALIGDLADVVAQAAAAIRTGSAGLADEALDRARSTQRGLDLWASALAGGEEVSRLSPLLHRRRGELERLRRGLVGLDRATRNMRVAVRRVAAGLDSGEPLPADLVEVLDDLALALRALRHEFRGRAEDRVAGGALVALASRLDPEALGVRSLSAIVIVGQVRSAVIDLLEVTGMDHQQARGLLPGSPPGAGPG